MPPFKFVREISERRTLAFHDLMESACQCIGWCCTGLAVTFLARSGLSHVTMQVHMQRVNPMFSPYSQISLAGMADAVFMLR